MESKTRDVMLKAPPAIEQPNIFPLDWPSGAPITHELYELAKKQVWDPANLPWEELKDVRLSAEEKLAIGYWFSLLGVFDASAPPVFARVLMEMYQAHEEDGILPPDFVDNHNKIQELAASGGLGILPEKEREAAWRNAMLRVKGIVEKYGIAFPAMPEVGISGEEYVEDLGPEGIIPVF